MTITSIERQKNNETRYSIFVDGEFSFGLSGTDVLFYKLREGDDIDEKTLDYLKNEVEFIKARDSAIRYIGYRMRSEWEVVNKLRLSGYDGGTISKVIELIKSHGYIDDIKYCLAFINEKMKLNGFGKIRIAHELQKRGVSKENIEKAYLSFAESLEENSGTSLKDIELEKASEALRKKYGDSIREPEQRKKAYDFLARRGFPSSVIHQCLKPKRTPKPASTASSSGSSKSQTRAKRQQEPPQH